MTQQNKNVPDLRFPEFCGDWGDKVVKQLAQINPSNSKLPNEFTYIDLDSVNSGVLTKKSKIRLKDAPSRAQRLLQKGDVLYQMVRPYQKNNLTFNLDGDFVASTGFAQLRAKDSTGFLYQLINTDKFTRKVILRCTGTSYPAINSSDLSTISIQSPEKPEQQKIADFLSAVDERVDGLRRKKELLEQYKKGVMQKIFSQEIRFTQPDGTAYPDWEEQTLGGIDIYISDGNYGEMYPKASEMKSEGVPFIRANNMTNNKVVWEDMKFISPDLHSILTSGHLKGEDILVTTRGDIGCVAYVDKEFDGANINAQICLLRSENKINALYLLQVLTYKDAQKQFKQLQTGSALKQLPKGNLAKVKFPFPHPDEQKLIADFLSAVDAKVEAIQNQLKQAETFKKALLQQMFV